MLMKSTDLQLPGAQVASSTIQSLAQTGKTAFNSIVAILPQHRMAKIKVALAQNMNSLDM